MLPKSPRLRRILIAYTVNELGTWLGYVALAMGVYDHTHSAIATAGLFLARGLIPALAAPLLVARVERSPGPARLTGLYLGESALTLCLAALLWRFWLPGVLALVLLDGVAAVAATALVRAAAARIASEESLPGLDPSPAPPGPDPQARAVEAAQRQANGALNVAYMITLAIGPAIGGTLVNGVGGPLTLVIDALTFFCCGLLLTAVRTHIEEEGADSIRARLRAAWRHMQAVPELRILLITEAIAIVFFASAEPVEVLYVKATLHGGDLGFGALLGTWGAGAEQPQPASRRCNGRLYPTHEHHRLSHRV